MSTEKAIDEPFFIRTGGSISWGSPPQRLLWLGLGLGLGSLRKVWVPRCSAGRKGVLESVSGPRMPVILAANAKYVAMGNFPALPAHQHLQNASSAQRLLLREKAT